MVVGGEIFAVVTIAGATVALVAFGDFIGRDVGEALRGEAPGELGGRGSGHRKAERLGTLSHNVSNRTGDSDGDNR